jgi:Mce-associated membrane protein
MTASVQQPTTATATSTTSTSVVALAAGVVVICLVLSVFAVVRLVQGVGPSSADKADASARAAALAAANQVGVDFTTLDYKTLTQDFNNLAALCTPTYRKSLLTQTPGTAELIVKAKGRSTGTVVSRAVQNMTPSTNPTKADVILAVNDTITNVKNPKGQVSFFRLDVSLQLVKGKWLASAVNLV